MEKSNIVLRPRSEKVREKIIDWLSIRDDNMDMMKIRALIYIGDTIKELMNGSTNIKKS